MNSQKEWEWDQSGCWVQKCMPDPAMDLNPRVLESMLKNEGTIFILFRFIYYFIIIIIIFILYKTGIKTDMDI